MCLQNLNKDTINVKYIIQIEHTYLIFILIKYKSVI